MEYLLAWRMAVAKDLLRREGLGLAEVAERVGYGSASTFSTAFSRHVGQPPGRYARAGRQSGGGWYPGDGSYVTVPLRLTPGHIGGSRVGRQPCLCSHEPRAWA
jgi:AraC-like DNA-binding protein